MKQVSFVFLVLIAALAAIAYLSLFVVHQTQLAIVLQFGNPQRIVSEPGLGWKIPLIQNVVYFDKRILDIDTAPQEVIAADRKRLVVDAFARYKITDPLLFLQTVGDQTVARSRLGNVLEASMRRVLGSQSFAAVVSDQRESLMQSITEQVNQEAKSFGVEVIDVRIKRADLPDANSQAIYRRMQTERAREAAEIRAGGEEISRRIRATGDRQVVTIKADATRDAERIRGEGDATRNRIYADAYNQDQDFFAFYRSMQAYETGLPPDGTRLVISPTSEFFRYFNDPSGGTSPRPASNRGATPPTGGAPEPEGTQPQGVAPGAQVPLAPGSPEAPRTGAAGPAAADAPSATAGNTEAPAPAAQ